MMYRRKLERGRASYWDKKNIGWLTVEYRRSPYHLGVYYRYFGKLNRGLGLHFSRPLFKIEPYPMCKHPLTAPCTGWNYKGL